MSPSRAAQPLAIARMPASVMSHSLTSSFWTSGQWTATVRSTPSWTCSRQPLRSSTRMEGPHCRSSPVISIGCICSWPRCSRSSVQSDSGGSAFSSVSAGPTSMIASATALDGWSSMDLKSALVRLIASSPIAAMRHGRLSSATGGNSARARDDAAKRLVFTPVPRGRDFDEGNEVL
eukprot:1876080-Prymnesium_polylepis.1